MREGRWIAAALLASFALLCVDAARRSSATMDEASHLYSGWRALRERDFTWEYEHPPLGKILAAAPLLPLDPVSTPVPVEAGTRRPDTARAIDAFVSFLFRDNPPTERTLFLARLPIVLLGVILAGAVGWVARARYGAAAGLLAMALCAFDPNLLAHAGLVTTDLVVVLTSFLAVVLFSRALDRRRLPADLAAGVAFGLAQASKHTALLLVPILGGLALARAIASGRGARLRPLLTLLVAFAAGGVTLWACYAFETGPLLFERERFDAVPEALGLRHLALGLNERALPLPSYLWGLRHTIGFSRQGGWPAFLLGEESAHGGFRLYYPVAFLVKTPLATLALVAAGFALRGRWRLRLRREGDLLFAAAVFFGASVASDINIGVRHILPVYPFLFVVASRVAPAAIEAARRLPRFALAGAVTTLAGSTLAAHPYHLAYFHEAVGGGDGGRRILLDSNVDWGQGLIGLRSWLADHGVERVKLHYFGTALPEAYGIEWEPISDAERNAPGDGVFAVSVMSLANVCGEKSRFAWLREREPSAKIAHSIWVWDLRRDGARGG